MTAQLPLLVLVVHVPGGSDQHIEITDWRTVIGRSSKCDIKIVSKQISKIHAAIEITDGVPTVRDLGSKNGVELNGRPITRPERLNAGDELVIGDAQVTVDPQSVLFRPREAQVALQQLLVEEQALRQRETGESTRRSPGSQTVNESFVPTRQSAHLVGAPKHNAAGAQPILRVLRIAGDAGPRDVARIEPFVLRLSSGEGVWIKPRRDVDLAHLENFPAARQEWIDEPEDFGGPGAHAMIIGRSHYYLPAMIEVLYAEERGRGADGARVFAEAGADVRIVIAPTDA